MRNSIIFFIFLIINFGALGLGSLLMNNGPMTEWYINLNKAPWTPPGWVFGVAWTTIMVCFSFYMLYLYNEYNSTKVKILFTIQLILNISWNYLFFNQHLVSAGLVVITLLTILTFYFLISFKKKLALKSVFILPYFIWLCIATSLNAYILFYN
jgi:tryptophan-rich sensory protein